MNEFAVYTFGGGEILGSLFNGIAMIFSLPNEYFTPVAKLSLAIGGLWAAMRAILGANLGIFGRQWFLPTFVILTLFFAPKVSIHLIDQSNPNHRHQKIDNIPAGIGLIASLASTLSYALTEKLEDIIRPVGSDAFQYTKTGPLFGAKILAAAQDLRIGDPTARENVKKFANQCFTWPYVITNLEGKRGEACQVDDIVGFVEREAHPSLGMYWKERDGSSSFQVCRSLVPKVRRALKEEETSSLLTLASSIGAGDAATPSEVVGSNMKRYVGDAWSEVTKASKSVHEVTGQQMMINAYREGYDDMREEHGLMRLYPRLVSMQATRGIMQQNMGWMVGGAIAAEYLPVAQTVIFALLLCAIVIVLPMSLLPGGLQIIGTWIKMVFWVQSWPILFAILSGIGGFALQARMSSILPLGSGLNIATQTGFAEVAFNTYCMVQNLLLAVPFISWAIISKGGHALVSMAERIVPSMLGGSMGASMVDNTHNFDTISAHNRTIATEQLAQQSIGSHVSTARSFDDGAVSVRFDDRGGAIFQEGTSQLKNNLSLTDVESTSLSKQAEKSLQVAETASKEASVQEAMNTQQAVDLMSRWGHGVSGIEGYSKTQNASLNESIQRLDKMGVSVSDVASTIDNTNIRGNVGVNVDTSRGIGGKVLEFATGIKGHAGINGEVSVSNQDSTEFKKTADQSLDDIKNVSEALQLAKEGRVTTTDDESHALSQSARESHDRSRSLRESESVARTESERYAEAASHVKSLSAQMATNINDEVLDYVAQDLFGGNKEAAMRWQTNHGQEFRSYAEEYLKTSGFNKSMADMVAQKGDINPETIEANWQKARGQIDHVSRESMEHERGVLSREIEGRAGSLGVSAQKVREQEGSLRQQGERSLSHGMEEKLSEQLEERKVNKERIEDNAASVSQKAENTRGTLKVVRMAGQMTPGASIKEEVRQASEKIGD